MNQPAPFRYDGTCRLCAAPVPAGTYGVWHRALKAATCMVCVDAGLGRMAEVSTGSTTAEAVPLPTIRLRYAAPCAACGTVMAVGTEAMWDRAAKRGTHATCPVPAPEGDARVEVPVEPVPIDVGVAGGSARRVADRQQAKRDRLKQQEDDAIRQAHPRIGGLLVKVCDILAEPEKPTSWQKGAAGEEAVGRTLERLTAEGFVILHDRRKPGTKWNIDHIIVGPRGVYVLDAKHYSGHLEIRSTGTFFRPAPDRVYVNGRPQDKRVAAMDWQVACVRDAAGDLIDLHGGVVKPVLCFLGVTSTHGQRPGLVGPNGVLVTWPRRFVKDVGRDGTLSGEHIDEIAGRIAGALPAAVTARN